MTVTSEKPVPWLLRVVVVTSAWKPIPWLLRVILFEFFK